jgi:DNA-binding ferritin-like protein
MNISLENLANVAMMLRHDLHFLHHHIQGQDFKDIHEWFGELYDLALNDADYYAEHSDSVDNKPIDNFVLAPKDPVAKEWDSITGSENISVDKGLELFLERIQDYFDCMDECREDQPNFVQSDMDSMRSEWEVAVYKCKRELSKHIKGTGE